MRIDYCDCCGSDSRKGPIASFKLATIAPDANRIANWMVDLCNDCLSAAEFAMYEYLESRSKRYGHAFPKEIL